MPAGPTLSELEFAHVLFMDVVGFSQKPNDDQARLLDELLRAVRDSPAFQRAEAASQLLCLPTGDGMALVFFASPEAPARCALDVTRALRPVPDLELRMGIHSGAVYRVPDINAAENVAGEGINTAQQVVDCADAGHILLSGDIAKVL